MPRRYSIEGSGTGYKLVDDRQGAWMQSAEVLKMLEMCPMQADRDDWLYTDERGDVWRLKRTGDPSCPFMILAESKR